ncbi:hypothetical protein [Azospirillum formosense]|uniref:hypothetical protein n=1 Tax=Azospirillum formosense TaxID=861533 RepID=UPI00338F9555
MALIKSIPTDFGIDARYWHIYSVDHNRQQQAAQVVLAGYLDESVRRAGHRPLATLTLMLAGSDYPGTPQGLDYAALYERIKSPASDNGTPPGVLAGALDA